ncbi:hypothetical protein MTO96_033434 [Rhipicephalus appendiculatus]
MSSRVQDMEVRLLLSAIQKTTGFEALLGRRFTGVTLERTNVVAPPDTGAANALCTPVKGGEEHQPL